MKQSPSASLFSADTAMKAVLLLVNGLFVYKYMVRYVNAPWLPTLTYLLLMSFVLWKVPQWLSSEKWSKALAISLMIALVGIIIAALIVVEPLSVNVDRWSATTYWLDAFSRGQYPYAVHTHVGETNFPSPFPIWHLLNAPFWLVGDVGLGLIVALLGLAFMVKWFFGSWRPVALLLLFLALSPAYLWEIAVRSDAMSNAILVVCFILFVEKRRWSFSREWWQLAVLCGLLASTRLWVAVPLAIYLLKDAFLAPPKNLIRAAVLCLAVYLLTLAPFIFWGGSTEAFAAHNPLSTESSTGSPWIAGFFAAVIFGAARYVRHPFISFLRGTGLIILFFFLVALIHHHAVFHSDISWMADPRFDISYLSLALPYCLLALVSPKPAA